MKIHQHLFKFVTAFIIVASVCSASAQFGDSQTGQSWFTVGKDGYVVLPPLAVGTGLLHQTAWSPDGKYELVAMQQSPLTPTLQPSDLSSFLDPQFRVQALQTYQNQLYLWSSSTMKTKVVWQGNMTSNILEVQWFHSGKTALVIMQHLNIAVNKPPHEETSLLLVDAVSGQSHELMSNEMPEQGSKIRRATYEMALSPTSDEAVISQSVTKINRVGSESDEIVGCIIDGQGNIKTNFNVQGLEEFLWGADGTELYAQSNRWDAATRKSQKTYFLISPSGEVDRLQQKPQLYKWPTLPIKSDVVLDEKLLPVKVGGSYRSMAQVMIESKVPKSIEPECLLQGIVRTPSLAPGNSAVGYECNGTYYIRRIIPMPPGVLALLIATEKAVALSDAKQVMLSMLMYANDNNDDLPSGSGWQNEINPYLKNPALAMNFNYSEPSNLNMTQIEDPATTVIGTVDGPGGQAVAFLDGHVRWQSNP